MLQELTFGRLENEFYNIKPTDSNLVVCVNKNCILVKKNEDGSIDFPTVAEAKCWAENSKWESWREEYFQYLFRMQEENYFLWMGNAGDCTDAAYQYEEIRQISFLETKDACFPACTAMHLFNWYRTSKYCGCCQTQTVHDTKERMMHCQPMMMESASHGR